VFLICISFKSYNPLDKHFRLCNFPQKANRACPLSKTDLFISSDLSLELGAAKIWSGIVAVIELTPPGHRLPVCLWQVQRHDTELIDK